MLCAYFQLNSSDLPINRKKVIHILERGHLVDYSLTQVMCAKFYLWEDKDVARITYSRL